jgi:hypothetical protein
MLPERHTHYFLQVIILLSYRCIPAHFNAVIIVLHENNISPFGETKELFLSHNNKK